MFFPKKNHYDDLEVDEIWTFVGSKKNKVWLIYVYDRGSGEIVAYARGKRDITTVRELEARLNDLKMTYGNITMDKWQSFVKVFGSEKLNLGKKYTVGIEGNNCRLRHRIRRIVRKTCCFSKEFLYHFKAFDPAFHYINYGSPARHTFQATTRNSSPNTLISPAPNAASTRAVNSNPQGSWANIVPLAFINMPILQRADELKAPALIV